uniref:Uncharacterized protein n=1 Tax=Psilocybe cubensis TaxID=181762 RepID=A0A8H8CPL0_PSICU
MCPPPSPALSMEYCFETEYTSNISTFSNPTLDVPQTPSLCTCNNVFFNIWSACSFASGNNTLPMFSLWSSTCTARGISLEASNNMKNGGGSMMGIEIPAWADIPVPGNTAFDLQQAVVLSQKLSTRSKWTTMQILLPILSAVLGVLFTLIAIALRSRHLRHRHVYTPTQNSKATAKSRMSVPRFPFISRIIHPSRRVRPLDQRSLPDWVIDEPTGSSASAAGAGLIAPPPSLNSGGTSSMNVNVHTNAGSHASAHARDQTVVLPPSPSDTPHRDSTVPGHPSIYSETPRQSVAAHESVELSIPGSASTAARERNRGVYPFGREAQELNMKRGAAGGGVGTHDIMSGRYVHPATTATNSNAASTSNLPTTSNPTSYFPSPFTSNANSNSNTPGTSTPRTGWGSSIRDVSVRLPNPFRRRPVPIVSTVPTERFRIDGSSEGSASVRESVALPPPRGTGRVTPLAPNVGEGRVAILDDFYHGDEGIDHEMMLGQEILVYGDSEFDDEGTNLITEDERLDSVRYSESNSRTTHGTSIDSKIRIESPTASTVSPRSSMPGTAGYWPRNKSIPLPALPPVPNLPAPLPPPPSSRMSPRVANIPTDTPIASGSGLRLNSPPANSSNTRMMSPIPEDQNSIRAVNPPRQLELPASIAQTSSTSSVRPLPTRSASGDSDMSVMSSSSSRRPLPSPAISVSSPSTANLQNQHQHQRSTSGSASTRGRLPDTPPLYFNNPNNAHRRSFSNNSASSSSINRTISPPPAHPHPPPPPLPHPPPPRDLFDDPIFVPHRRGLSADDTASFYLTPDTSTSPRSGTPLGVANQSSGAATFASASGSRVDPAVFFPGPVRGAGYGS